MSRWRVIVNDSLMKKEERIEDCPDKNWRSPDRTLNVSVTQPINKSILAKFTDERDVRMTTSFKDKVRIGKKWKIWGFFKERICMIIRLNYCACFIVWCDQTLQSHISYYPITRNSSVICVHSLTLVEFFFLSFEGFFPCMQWQNCCKIGLQTNTVFSAISARKRDLSDS